MVSLDFMVLAAACAPAIHPTTLSAVVMQESQGNIYAIGINGNYKLPHQPSTFEEAIATAEQLKRSGYNFDVGLGQINIRNLEWLGMSLSDLFDPCKNLKAVQTVLVHCYERAMLKYSSGQAALQAALSCYNTGNFKRGFINKYVQKVASRVGVKVPVLMPIDSDEVQEFVQHQTKTQEQTVNVKPSIVPQEELVDAFKSKASSVHDAFTVKDPSSFAR
ncbi:lytic transglycosylase domain-containing protein [Bartonella sp. B17]